MDNRYVPRVQWLVDLLPLVAEEDCFALKGGTAINFFVRNMPRLSVDIDLVFLPALERREALREIAAALERIGERIAAAFPQVAITRSFQHKADSLRLLASRGPVQVKIELSPVLRGTVFKPGLRRIVGAAEQQFGMVEMNVVSTADLYGGKICAALDRQHPRDLFDIKVLLENEGISGEIRKAFLVYLISHPRPMAELLCPGFKPLDAVFATEFSTMATVPVSIRELESAREALVRHIRDGITQSEKRFLLSFKQCQPEWALLGLDGVDKLPAVRWKLRNLKRMPLEKHTASIAKLTHFLAG